MYKFAKKVANHEGFTLVELIVVIAILGILAGIAIPVYSGYINKANQAADNVLLSAVNTALGAARAENGFAKLGADAKLIVTSKKITGLNPGTVTLADSTDTLSAAIAASFVTYFGDNVNVELKYCTSDADFEFHTDTQCFAIVGSGTTGVSVTNNGDGTYTVTLSNGQTVTFVADDEAIETVQASTFGNGSMTMGELTSDVSGVVTAAVNALGGQVNRDDYETEEEYQAALAEAEQGKVNTLKSLLGGDAGMTALGLDPTQDYTSAQLGNALVVMVAQNTGDATADMVGEALGTIAEGGSIAWGDLVDMSDLPGTLSNVACVYGLVTGYANSDYGKNSTITTDDGRTISVYQYFNEESAALMDATSGSNGLFRVLGMVSTVMESDGLAGYMGYDAESGEYDDRNSQAIADLMGYLATMNVISDNSDALISGAGVLNSGFASSDIVAILNSIFGG